MGHWGPCHSHSRWVPVALPTLSPGETQGLFPNPLKVRYKKYFPLLPKVRHMGALPTLTQVTHRSFHFRSRWDTGYFPSLTQALFPLSIKVRHRGSAHSHWRWEIGALPTLTQGEEQGFFPLLTQGETCTNSYTHVLIRIVFMYMLA